MQSLVTVTEQTQIGINDLPLGVARATFLKDQPTLTMSKIGGALYRMNFNTPKDTLPKMRRHFEREYIHQIIEENGGNKTLAAKEIGLTRAALYHILKENKV